MSEWTPGGGSSHQFTTCTQFCWNSFYFSFSLVFLWVAVKFRNFAENRSGWASLKNRIPSVCVKGGSGWSSAATSVWLARASQGFCDAFYLLKPTVSFEVEEKAEVKEAFPLWVLASLAVAWARSARSLLQTQMSSSRFGKVARERLSLSLSANVRLEAWATLLPQPPQQRLHLSRTAALDGWRQLHTESQTW